MRDDVRFLGQCCGFVRGCRKNVKGVGECGKVVQNLCSIFCKIFPKYFLHNFSKYFSHNFLLDFSINL